MKTGFAIVGVVILFIVFYVGCGILNTAGWFASRSIDVVKQQVDPAELLRKYELFKDEAAQLDAKLANIKIKEGQIKEVKEELKVSADRTNREQMMIWEQELGGIEYRYNALAADYNAQMAKINYRFCNVGELPQGASEPLPREYNPYLEK